MREYIFQGKVGTYKRLQKQLDIFTAFVEKENRNILH